MGTSTKAKTPPDEARDLSVKLSAVELDLRAKQLAKCEFEIERVTLESTAARARFKAELDTVEASRGKLARAIDTGHEPREIMCRWVADFPRNVWRLINPETGEQVDTRAMTTEDRQGGLFDHGKAERTDAHVEPLGTNEVVNVEGVVASDPPPARKAKRKSGRPRSKTKGANGRATA